MLLLCVSESSLLWTSFWMNLHIFLCSEPVSFSPTTEFFFYYFCSRVCSYIFFPSDVCIFSQSGSIGVFSPAAFHAVSLALDSAPVWKALQSAADSSCSEVFSSSLCEINAARWRLQRAPLSCIFVLWLHNICMTSVLNPVTCSPCTAKRNEVVMGHEQNHSAGQHRST